jgi:hypothetical protein
MRPAIPALLLVSLLVPAAAGPLPVAPAVAGRAGAPPAEEDDAGALVTAIAPVVEEIRGLRFRKPVAVERTDDAAARAHFEGRLRLHWPRSRLRAEEGAYADLGLLPAGASLADALLATLEEQAAGYYDPARGTFVVLADMPRSMAPVIVAHELTHALDDQHFDIDGLLAAAGGSGERAGGVAAVVEGSATLVMTLFIVREMAAGRLETRAMQALRDSEAGQARRLKAAPPILQRLLVGPYVLGMRFLLKGNLAATPREAVPRGDVDRAFQDPPVSWEQVLHPEKYWDPGARDLPRPVVLPDLAAALDEGWSLRGEGELGEMILAILTEPAGAPPLDPTDFADTARWTNPAAAGWGGDRWQLYQSGGRSVTLLATLWDSARDAREFRAALPRRLRRASARRGDAVVVAAGDPDGRGPALVRAALRALSGWNATRDLEDGGPPARQARRVTPGAGGEVPGAAATP